MLETFDQHWLRSLHETCPSSWQTPMEIITFFGSSWALGSIAFFAAVVLIFQRRTKDLIFLAAAGISSQILNEGIKRLVRRPRPQLWPTPLPHSFSFPSGHALGALLVFGALGYLAAKQYPRQKYVIGSVSLLLVFLIGFSRLYLGVHWPTDVLAGWVFGGGMLAGLIYWREKSPPPAP